MSNKAHDWIERLNPDGLTKTLIGIVVLVACVAIGALVLYLSQFHAGLSSDQAIWGQFGDYVGGILNPLVSLVTLLGLLLTILLQRSELKMAHSEIEKNRQSRSVDMMLRLEERFEATQMHLNRRTAAKHLLQYNEVESRAGAKLDSNDYQWTDVDDVLNFFEVVGIVTRLGHVDQELVYKFFFPWLHYYWQGAKAYIDAERSRPTVVWDDLAWLYRLLCDEEKRLNGGVRIPVDQQRWRDFMETEATLP